MDFHDFVCSRRAHDNPRGDFIEDTKLMARCHPGWRLGPPGRFPYPGRPACDEAVRAWERLWREFLRLRH